MLKTSGNRRWQELVEHLIDSVTRASVFIATSFEWQQKSRSADDVWPTERHEGMDKEA
jgi:hypothetical protein